MRNWLLNSYCKYFGGYFWVKIIVDSQILWGGFKLGGILLCEEISIMWYDYSSKTSKLLKSEWKIVFYIVLASILDNWPWAKIKVDLHIFWGVSKLGEILFHEELTWCDVTIHLKQ